MSRHFRFKVLFVDGSRSAEDAAKNASDATAAKNASDATIAENASDSTVARPVALVSVPSVLPIAFIIAAHKALTKSLGGGILVIARTLWVVALPTLAITCAGVQASLVPLVQLNLIPVVVPIVIVIATVAAIPTIVVIAPISPIAPITSATIPIPVASPIPALSFVIITILMLFPDRKSVV